MSDKPKMLQFFAYETIGTYGAHGTYVGSAGEVAQESTIKGPDHPVVSALLAAELGLGAGDESKCLPGWIASFCDWFEEGQGRTLSHCAVSALCHTLIAARERTRRLVRERDAAITAATKESPPVSEITLPEAVTLLRAAVEFAGAPSAPCPECLHPEAVAAASTHRYYAMGDLYHPVACRCECHNRRVEFINKQQADALAATAHLVPTPEAPCPPS